MPAAKRRKTAAKTRSANSAIRAQSAAFIEPLLYQVRFLLLAKPLRIMAFVMRADGEADLGLTEQYIGDVESAITILEHMVEFNRMPDPEVLISLHHDVAEALMKVGRTQDAEKHMMRALRLGVQGTGDNIEVHGPGN